MRYLTPAQSERMFPKSGVRCIYCGHHLCWGHTYNPKTKTTVQRSNLFCGRCDLDYHPISR